MKGDDHIVGVYRREGGFKRSAHCAVMTLVTILGVTRILCSFRLVLDGNPLNEIPESSRFDF